MCCSECLHRPIPVLSNPLQFTREPNLRKQITHTDSKTNKDGKACNAEPPGRILAASLLDARQPVLLDVSPHSFGRHGHASRAPSPKGASQRSDLIGIACFNRSALHLPLLVQFEVAAKLISAVAPRGKILLDAAANLLDLVWSERRIRQAGSDRQRPVHGDKQWIQTAAVPRSAFLCRFVRSEPARTRNGPLASARGVSENSSGRWVPATDVVLLAYRVLLLPFGGEQGIVCHGAPLQVASMPGMRISKGRQETPPRQYPDAVPFSL